ncbi:MAG: N-acetylmuramoyl-L-alanine amidase, partial [Patescibacteria group bacterium]
MKKLFQHKFLGLNFFVMIAIVIGIIGSGLWLYIEDREANKTVITSKTIKGNKVLGEVVEGENNSGKKNRLSTKTQLVYQSKSINTYKNTSTAAVVSWSQQGDSGEHTGLEMRVRDGDKWSDWMYTSSEQDDRKDGTKPLNSGIILSKDISKVQYRLSLDKYSPEINLSSIKVEAIDSSKGPSISNKTTWQKLGDIFGINNSVNARLKGPTIKSRAGWGSPEPNSSPRWTPKYEPVKRVIVHHTAATPNADSSAAVRAVWHYHANSRGWGDIGYNYLVDQSGNIFHGRYTNAEYAEQNNVDVVGGHAYGNNLRTVGIAALGDFTNRTPSSASIRAIGEVAAFKGGPYGLNPSKGTRLVGHRNVRSTSCPGAKLYAKLSNIRRVANALYPRYYVPPYAWKYVNQYVYSDESRQTQIDPSTTPLMSGNKIYVTVQARNIGAKKWFSDGLNPIRLASTNPKMRESSFCDSDSWIDCTRPTAVAENGV